MGARAAGVVEFWRGEELLSPQRIPRHAPANDVFDAQPGAPLPWTSDHSLRRRKLSPGFVWRYVVYVGVHSIDEAYGSITPLLPAERESYDRRPAGEGALMAFAATAEGRPILGSETLSSCAWGIGRIFAERGVRRETLNGFKLAQEAFAAQFAELVAPTLATDEAGEDDVQLGEPLDDLLLERCRAMTEAMLGTERLFATGGARIECAQVNVQRAHDGDHDFLNSFIAEDLGHVATELRAGRAGSALLAYLADEVDTHARLDVESDDGLAHLREALLPERLPAGRWPDSPDRTLALGQQFAVTASLAAAAGPARLKAVNGPPGTGKTTMLRELIAANVVARADRLATLKTPQAAFGRARRWSSGDYSRTTYPLAPQLTGFEMVVTCASNSAAENISMELPAADAISRDWGDAADYFSEIACETLASRSRAATPPRAWGLVSACLGRRSNCRAFADALWWGRPHDDEPPPTLRGFLGDALANPGSWEDAVATYRGAQQAELALRAERQESADALVQLPTAVTETVRAETARTAAADARDAAAAALADQRDECERRAGSCDRRRQARIEHAQFRPGFLQSLFTLGRAMRAWSARDEQLADALMTAENGLEQERERETQLERALADATWQLTSAEAELSAARKRLDSLRSVEADARERWGDHLPDADWWADRARRELRAPWCDDAWNRARSDRFLAALQLHKAFIAGAARQMQANLWGVVDLLRGSAPRDLDAAVARATWQSLFLVVPVLSTTFASFPRLFSHLGREALGWVLIDEAGQATPQQAVGPLWRSRQAVAIGDPLQLSPIVTLPFTIEQSLRLASGVGERWLPSRSSVQQLADRVMPVGAWRGGDDSDPLWVGAPLIVHRRCDEPMFSIANDIAYQGQMIDGGATRDPLPLPTSGWLDVVSPDGQGNWVPAEGQQLARLLRALDDRGVAGEDVFVISPFRDVAFRIRSHIRSYAHMRGGTIHTTQGREADVVILVLGGAPNRPGAKAWAAERPNMLNVAVTRARRRLYVIGDRAAWARQPHFRVLAQRLPILTEE